MDLSEALGVRAIWVAEVTKGFFTTVSLRPARRVATEEFELDLIADEEDAVGIVLSAAMITVGVGVDVSSPTMVSGRGESKVPVGRLE